MNILVESRMYKTGVVLQILGRWAPIQIHINFPFKITSTDNSKDTPCSDPMFVIFASGGAPTAESLLSMARVGLS
jgi:hypothetical protein